MFVYLYICVFEEKAFVDLKIGSDPVPCSMAIVKPLLEEELPGS